MAKTKNATIASNRKAYHNYFISEKFEAGIVLHGCEVKSIREGKITIKEGYARFINDELWLVGCHILPYFAATQNPPSPTRDRKLLMRRVEIDKLLTKINQKGFVLVPLAIYLSKSKVKISLGLGKPKKLHDKRNALKEKDEKREMDRSLKPR
jgi:SsrA-binding protein